MNSRKCWNSPGASLLKCLRRERENDQAQDEHEQRHDHVVRHIEQAEAPRDRVDRPVEYRVLVFHSVQSTASPGLK